VRAVLEITGTDRVLSADGLIGSPVVRRWRGRPAIAGPAGRPLMVSERLCD